MQDDSSFHKLRFESENSHRAVSSLYQVAKGLFEEYESLVFEGCQSLELGCGAGLYAREAYKRGLKPMVSDRNFAALRSGSPGLKSIQTQCETLPLKNLSMDLIYGAGILHHCDLKQSVLEIHRVLKPGGKAIFIEPLSFNPIYSFFRILTPSQRCEGERPFGKNELNLIRGIFPHMKESRFGVIAPLLFPLLKTRLISSKRIYQWERTLCQTPLKNLAWISLIQLQKS